MEIAGRVFLFVSLVVDLEVLELVVSGHWIQAVDFLGENFEAIF